MSGPACSLIRPKWHCTTCTECHRLIVGLGAQNTLFTVSTAPPICVKILLTPERACASGFVQVDLATVQVADSSGLLARTL